MRIPETMACRIPMFMWSFWPLITRQSEKGGTPQGEFAIGSL